MSITYSVRPYWGETEPQHCWLLTEAGEVVSELWADLATGQIMQVETAAHRRGEGLARALYEAAPATVDLYHSPVEHRTPEGDAFARAVGGDTIPADLAYVPDFVPDYDDDLEADSDDVWAA